jgi:acetyl-CoA synthetase
MLRPATVAVAGGEVAAEVIRQCRAIGFRGPIWPINNREDRIEGIATFARVDDLPGAPDASFLAVRPESTIELLGALARRGAGGAVCYASGFAEAGGKGAALQERLVRAAGDMAVFGPNCYGFCNYLDGCALWPDHQGGRRVERGVAIITQSGNIALNLTMQRRHVPIAYMMSIGNKAVTDVHDCMDALLTDPRVSAIGLHIEALQDVPAFSRAALAALDRGVPIVALKAGSSEIGARLTASHTSALAGPEVLYAALFERVGVARVHDLDELLETLKLLHVCGSLAGRRVSSLSCSGGDASLMADLGSRERLEFPPFPAQVEAALHDTLGEHVTIHNPLDYQTAIWGDEKAMTDCFGAVLRSGADANALILDFPNTDADAIPGWDEVVDAYLAADARRESTQRRNSPALLVSSMAELLPETIARRMLAAGVAPMQGLRECTVAIAGAAAIGARRAASPEARSPLAALAATRGRTLQLDELAAKSALAAHGLQVPKGGAALGVEAAVELAAAIGYPVVVKALSADLAHKSEFGAVRVNLGDAEAVRVAATTIASQHGVLLVEKMVTGALLEMIVGVTRDAQFGLNLTFGAGGVWVELLGDCATLLLPTTRADIESGLRGLRCFPLLTGHRGTQSADLEKVVDAIAAVGSFALAHADSLVELDVNPFIVTAREVVAVDALLRVSESSPLV